MASFIATVVEMLRGQGPSEIFSLAAAVAPGPDPARGDDLWWLVGKILTAAKQAEQGLHIVDYPTYRLKGPVPSRPPRRRYVRSAVEALRESARPLSLRQLTSHYLRKYGKTAVDPEYQMFLALETEGKSLVTRQGELRVGLKAVAKAGGMTRSPGRQSRGESEEVDPIHAKLYEENLESLIAERLEELEPGLTLVRRQYVTPIGRIDLLCKDRQGNFVVIELKRFRATTDSIIDQVTRYVGWVQKHLAKPARSVRAYIVVGKVDRKLEYSVGAIPNLRVKCVRVSLSDPD